MKTVVSNMSWSLRAINDVIPHAVSSLIPVYPPLSEDPLLGLVLRRRRGCCQRRDCFFLACWGRQVVPRVVLRLTFDVVAACTAA